MRARSKATTSPVRLTILVAGTEDCSFQRPARSARFSGRGTQYMGQRSDVSTTYCSLFEKGNASVVVSMAKAKGLSLHIGLNGVDPKAYGGWAGPLKACEADAQDMGTIAKDGGFTSSLLLTKNATRAAVINGIKAASKKL